MSSRTWHLVCYDVRDDTRLRRIAKLLEGYGERLQYSVFRCRLAPRDVERLRWELTCIVAREDAWMIVPVCNTCLKGMRHRNGRREWPADPPKHVIV